MSTRTWKQEYGSLAEFYGDVYGQHITAIHKPGSLGATLFEAEQSAGDWSDAPTPDLTIAWLPSKPVRFMFDLGAGRVTGVQQRNDAILTAPGAGSTVLVEGAHVCRAVAMPYRALLSMTGGESSPLPADGDFGRLHAGLLRDPVLMNLLDAIWRETSHGGLHGALFADGALLQIAAVLLRMRDGHPQPAAAGLAPWQMKRATELLMSRLDGEVALAELAAELGLSASHLSRAFKASTGLPPWRWLAERRVERAKALLADPRLSLTDVAQMVGYAGQSTFGEAFRRATGLTPGQYRRGI